MTLKDIKTGHSAVVTKVGGNGSLRQHFLDMGIIPGENVTVEKYAPMGDPMQIKVHGYELTLRLDDAKNIEVSPCKKSDDKPAEKKASVKKKHSKNREIAHPGLGEEGKYHEKANEEPLPDDTILTYALVGNQNSGKTTLFNRLTGSRQHVGNFPGVTVDRKDGAIRDILKRL